MGGRKDYRVAERKRQTQEMMSPVVVEQGLTGPTVHLWDYLSRFGLRIDSGRRREGCGSVNLEQSSHMRSRSF